MALRAGAPMCARPQYRSRSALHANKAAQACFEYGWDEITSLPSRLSAERVDREERQKLLDEVARQGFAAGYSGLRIAKSGRRFWIEDKLQPSPGGATPEAFHLRAAEAPKR